MTFCNKSNGTSATCGAGTACPSKPLFTTGFGGFCVARSLYFSVAFSLYISLALLCCLAFILFVLFRFSASDYPFGIFNFFLPLFFAWLNTSIFILIVITLVLKCKIYYDFLTILSILHIWIRS